MGTRARRVLARWGVKLTQSDCAPKIAASVIEWVETHVRRSLEAKITPNDYVQELTRLKLQPDDHTFSPVPTLAEEAFDDAKLALEGALPKVLRLLESKFKDHFYMRATQQKLKLYYYFSGHPALETIALTLTMKGGAPLIFVGYIPMGISSGTADFRKAKSEQIIVRHPETAGLATLSVLRKLLAQIDMSNKFAALGDVSTPAAAAKVIEQKLGPLMQGCFLRVTHDRGVLVELGRMDPDEYIKKGWAGKFTDMPDNLYGKIIIAPSALGTGAWADLNLKFGGTPDEERGWKDHGLSIRKAGGLTPEKAVDSLIKWVVKNHSKFL